MSQPCLALSLQGITRRFGVTLACDAVDLSFGRGEIHALIGENGAGKSTAMRIACGRVRPDAGTVRAGEFETSNPTPAWAARAGLALVPQEPDILPNLSVLENVALGMAAAGRSAGPLQNPKAFLKDFEKAAARFGADLPPHAPCSRLDAARRFYVALIKAVLTEPNVLIFDETASLMSPPEAARFYELIRTLKSEGRTVIFITHALREAMENADRIAVMRRGRVVGAVAAAETSENELARLMVGEAVSIHLPEAPGAAVKTDVKTKPAPALELRGVTTKPAGGGAGLRDVSLTVAPGEIVGVAGVQGNGQRALAETVAGLLKPDGGKVVLFGQAAAGLSLADRIRAGLRVLPGDRDAEGLIADFSLADNWLLGKSAFAEGRTADDALQNETQNIVADWEIDARGGAEQTARSLSGGNRQKLLAARAIGSGGKLILAVNPTRGVDFRAAKTIQLRLREAAQNGAAVLLLSPDLDELMGLSTRLGVLFRGRLSWPGADEAKNRARLGLYMAGESGAAAGANNGRPQT